jgi:hypothetical protein
MIHTVEMPLCGMIFLPSSMNIGTGVDRILRFCLRNMKACNVDINDG